MWNKNHTTHRIPPIQARYRTKPMGYPQGSYHSKNQKTKNYLETQESLQEYSKQRSIQNNKQKLRISKKIDTKICGFDFDQYQTMQFSKNKKSKLEIFHCDNILINNGDSISICGDNTKLQLQKTINYTIHDNTIIDKTICDKTISLDDSISGNQKWDSIAYKKQDSITNKKRKKGIFDSLKNPTNNKQLDIDQMHIILQMQEIIPKCCT